MWHYLLHNFILFCTTDDGWWLIWNMSWLNMNFKNIVWFIKVIIIIVIIILISSYYPALFSLSRVLQVYSTK